MTKKMVECSRCYCRCGGEKMCVLQNRGGRGRRWWCGNSRRRLREGASMVVQQCFPARTGVGTKLVCADAGEAVSLMVRKWWLPAWCSGVRRDWRRRLCGWWKERRKLGLGFWEMKMMTWQDLNGQFGEWRIMTRGGLWLANFKR
ncbi:hypothetical protein DEO72_LG4g751 [Vigna unguiculata]|uniref:Uncharacterized protein n=1 Tax=Vigna unguiculata TaxID=3917 RepID=A0A4D6LLY4_VIGUN|nr:hypothetical protein DEO72_LG4g751 [Vigna unguiculata]